MKNSLNGWLSTRRITRSYVYVVYSCGNEGLGLDGRVEGVYINREEAEGKRAKLVERMVDFVNNQHIAILKKPLHGKNALWV